MEIYKAEEKWIAGVSGGGVWFPDKEPEAKIFSVKPVPFKWWVEPLIVRSNYRENEEWEFDSSFFQFIANEESLYVHLVEYRRGSPLWLSGQAEYFTTRAAVKGRLDLLKTVNGYIEYHWDDHSARWIEQ